MTDQTDAALVETHLNDGVLHLKLQGGTPHALSRDMVRALDLAFIHAEQSADVRVVVIEGPGHMFCAGHDLKEVMQHRLDEDDGEAFVTELFDACAAMMARLVLLPKPTVAMVDGIATAAGLQLVASCDMAFATPRASFCLPGVKNGGFCSTPAVAVSQTIGRKALMELLLTGEPKDADWALQVGLINRICEPETLAADTFAFAASVADKNPGPISAGISALNAHADLPVEDAYAIATPVMVRNFMDPGRRAREISSKFAPATKP